MDKYEEAMKLAELMVHDGIITQDCAEKIFPELKESEDERIRKDILDFIRREGQHIDKLEWHKWIAWLKKQGVKPTDKVEPKFKVGYKIQYSKGCGTIMTIEKIENGEYIFANNMGHTTIESGNKWYLVEQKPAWSEEDERIYQSIIDDTVQENQLDDKQTNWLKNIKYRYFPQSKQEWSEEDETIISAINGIINIVERKTGDWYYTGSEKVFYSDIRNWLKSLRPQNHRKPTE